MNCPQPDHIIPSFSIFYPHFPVLFYPFQTKNYNLCQNLHFQSLEFPLACQYKSIEEVDPPSFQTRTQRSIILKISEQSPIKGSGKSETAKISKAERQRSRPLTQKESRNVTSNLMRIFLKHVVELRFYDVIIQKMINRFSMGCSLEEFHQWLASLNINYKNYIRFTEIGKLFRRGENRGMERIMGMLLRQYTSGVGLEHCLTSKRIDRKAVSMHINGLRLLKKGVIAN